MIKWLVIIILIFQISCTKEIEINLDNQKALVLNSVFNPDEPFIFRISSTTPLLSDYETFNADAHLRLTENHRLIIDTLISTGILETNLNPKPGVKYSVELESAGYPAIKAIDTIPNLVPIDNAYMIFPSGVDAFGFYKAEACVSFTDPPNETNYYELVISSKPGRANAWYCEYETNDPVLQNEGDLDYHPTSFFFSDELFNGKSYLMRIKHGTAYSLKDNKLTAFPLYATLRSVSMNYYKYRKFFTRHIYNQQLQNEVLDLIFKGEPQNMFTNIENGYGIFAGFCESTTQMIQNE